MVALKVIFLTCFVATCYCEDDVGIIGGHQISIERAPFMASLRLNGTYHWCGASIIHERFVLTAAHCIVPNRTYKVLVGANHVDNKAEGKLYDVEKIISHKKYSNKTLNFDVCLIKLSTSLTFGPKVEIIKLADSSVKLPKNTMLNITGWGSTGHQKYSSHLNQVSIPTVSRWKCQLSYLHYKITSQMMCAGKRGEDTCQGDSGGPLTKNNVQVGITSFGRGCGEVPGVYAKVSTLLPWIHKNVLENL